MFTPSFTIEQTAGVSSVRLLAYSCCKTSAAVPRTITSMDRSYQSPNRHCQQVLARPNRNFPTRAERATRVRTAPRWWASTTLTIAQTGPTTRELSALVQSTAGGGGSWNGQSDYSAKSSWLGDYGDASNQDTSVSQDRVSASDQGSMSALSVIQGGLVVARDHYTFTGIGLSSQSVSEQMTATSSGSAGDTSRSDDSTDAIRSSTINTSEYNSSLSSSMSANASQIFIFAVSDSGSAIVGSSDTTLTFSGSGQSRSSASTTYCSYVQGARLPSTANPEPMPIKARFPAVPTTRPVSRSTTAA